VPKLAAMKNPSSLRRLLSLARPHLGRLIPATIALLFSSGLSLGLPMQVGSFVDQILKGNDPAELDRAILVLLGVFFLVGIAGGLRAYLFTTAGERVVTELRQDLYSNLIRQEIGFFDSQRTGELTNRLGSDTAILQNAVTVNVSMALRYVLSALGAVGILLYTSWQLTLVMLAIVPVVAVGAGIYGQQLRGVSRSVQDALARATAVAEETLSGVRTVRAFAREDQETARYASVVEESYALARKRALLGAGFQGGITFAGYAAIAAVLWYGGRMLSQGELSMGTLTSFMLYTFTLAFSIGALSGLYEDFNKALGASERVFELLDRKPVVSGGSQHPEKVAGAVTFDKISFQYPTRPDVSVLRDFTLTLQAGEVVALVGPSGGGKSTVAALLSRFYDPSAGTVCLDGVPYRDLDPNWLRGQVGVVAQEPILFATSIRDNIRYARPDATEAEVEAAAQAANAHDFIAAFPEGYGTLVGERGVRLSGGQKQRVAIARAILKNPRVLVLDEATSALDAESEHLVQEALDRLMKGRTTVVIAHRLSTVRDADRVVVLDGGKVVQAGPHEALVAEDGLYRRLVERQFAAG